MGSPRDFEIIERNLRQMMEYYARATGRGEVAGAPGLWLCSSGLDFGPFNAALITEPVTEAELGRRIGAARLHYGARGVRWSCWVCDDYLDFSTRRQVRKIFAQHGLHPLTEPPGMIAGEVRAPSRWLPELDCRPADSPATRLAFCEVTSSVFDVPLSVSRQVYDTEHSASLGFTAWVGYNNGMPVATAATIVDSGAIGVYSVATLPRYRKNGFAEVIMRRALSQSTASTGIVRSVLQTTRAGLRMYEHMGYRVATRFSVFMTG